MQLTFVLSLLLASAAGQRQHSRRGNGAATRPGAADVIPWLLGNITVYGREVTKFLEKNPEYQGASMPAAHIPKEHVLQVRRELLAQGWFSDVAPSQPVRNAAGHGQKEQPRPGASRLTGGEGGTLSLVKAHRAAEPLPELERLRDEGLVEDASGFVLHLRGGNLVLGCSYLRPSVGVQSGQNRLRLERLGGYLRSLGEAWCWFADWNVSPQALAATGWLSEVQGMILEPEDVSTTSSAGAGQLYDYLVVSQGAETAIKKCCWEPRARWKAHKSLRLELRRRPQTLVGPKLALPRSFPLVFRERAPPDPTSKAGRNRERLRLKAEEERRMHEAAAAVGSSTLSSVPPPR